MTNQLQVTYQSVDALTGYKNNSRTHSKQQVDQITKSINEFGFTNPILIDEDNGVIAGHGRLLASQKLKLDEVPCIVLDGLNEAQRKAYVIADNQLGLNSGWDFDTLTMEMEHLSDMDFNLSLLGFDDVELAKMFDEEQEIELKEQEYTEKFSIIIDCEDEEEQEKIFNRLDTEGYKCRVQSL